MSWNDRNPDLEPWEIPDREVAPSENGAPPSAGDQWMHRLRHQRAQRSAPRRPAPNRPAPPGIHPRAGLGDSLRKASRMANMAAVVFGVTAALLLIPALVMVIDTAVGIHNGGDLSTKEFLFGSDAVDSAGTSLATGALFLFWSAMSVALWRKSRVAAVLSLVVSFFQLLFFSLAGLGAFALPAFVFAIVGLIGAFRCHALRRPVPGGEKTGDRLPQSWRPETALGRVFLSLTLVMLIGSIVCTAVSAGLLEEAGSGSSAGPEFVGESWDGMAGGDYGDTYDDTDWGAVHEAELRAADPIHWTALKLPDAGVSLPVPEDVTLTDDGDYHSLMYEGDVTCFGASAYWYAEDFSGMTQEEAFETLEGLLEEYGEFEDERVAVPLATGVTDGGIRYAQLSIESDFGYVYAVRAFMTDSAVGCLTYDRYDFESWSQDFEDLANGWFGAMKPL